MVVDFKFDIGQRVYYVKHHGLSQGNSLAEGKIQGFQIRKTRHRNTIGVDFKSNNNVPIEFVSENKSEIQKLVDIYNSKSIEERINQ